MEIKMNFNLNQEPDENALPVKEFGKSVVIVSGLDEQIPEEAKRILEIGIADMEKVLSYITDTHYVKKFEIVRSPQVDKLRRFGYVGYYGVVASKGYDVLSDYFKKEHACRKRHRPERTDFKFVVSVFKDWLKDRKYRDWDDED